MGRPPKQSVSPAAAVFVLVCAVAGFAWGVSACLKPVEHMRSAVLAYTSTRQPVDYAKARRGFASALSVFPADHKVRIYLGHSHLMLGDYDLAEKAFSDVIQPKIQPGPMTQDRVRALVGLGAVKYSRGDFKAALAKFDEALKLWPNYREAHSRKALTLARMGKLKEAGKTAEQAIAYGADSEIPHLVLVQVYSASGDRKKAEDVFLSKIAKPDNPVNVDDVFKPGHHWDKAADYVEAKHLRFPVDTEPIHILATEQKARTK
jgi:tetratricopeptide (TPR) repeat protein